MGYKYTYFCRSVWFGIISNEVLHTRKHPKHIYSTRSCSIYFWAVCPIYVVFCDRSNEWITLLCLHHKKTPLLNGNDKINPNQSILKGRCQRHPNGFWSVCVLCKECAKDNAIRHNTYLIEWMYISCLRMAMRGIIAMTICSKLGLLSVST